MTTHEHPTQVPGRFDESQEALAGTHPVTEHTAPGVSAEPSAASFASAEPVPPSNAPAPALAHEANEVPAAPNGGRPAPVDPPTPADEVTPVADATAPAQHASAESSTEETLFADSDLADLRARWAGVQAAFVDDPKDCVQKADVLVSDLVEQLTSSFANARSRLEEQWAQGQEASTEDLRMALMHYREFFERLLAV